MRTLMSESAWELIGQKAAEHGWDIIAAEVMPDRVHLFVRHDPEASASSSPGPKDGKSVVVSDGAATTFGIPLMPGSDYTPVWAADETPVVPDSAQATQPRTYFPPAGGFRFCFFTLGPGTATLPDDFDAAAAAGQVQQDIPGLLDVFEADNPGMRTSDTVDVDFVLSGEVDVELDDGVEVHLKAGDVLVQHGTRHAWRNKSDQPCVLVVAVTGARRA